jgi:hypothetical protein
MTRGAIILPFRFVDYGSGCAQIHECGEDSDRLSGWIEATPRTIEMTGVPLDKVDEALRGDLSSWNAYVKGNIVGYSVYDEDGSVVDSCWNYYPDADGSYAEAVADAKQAAEDHAHEQWINAEPPTMAEILAGAA